MATIILSGTIVRAPLGGLALWHLAWITGIKAFGHDIYFFEKSMWENSCYDVSKKVMTDDCTYGTSVIKSLFAEYGLRDNWCFVDQMGNYHGMTKNQLMRIFKIADVFIDFEWGEWQEESLHIPIKVFVDGEPGWFQMKYSRMLDKNVPLPQYDYYFTNGILIGTEKCDVPTSGTKWLHTLSPALIQNIYPEKNKLSSPFTTVMKWKANSEIEFNGKNYGQKDLEFKRFIQLPLYLTEYLEVAVSGPSTPYQILNENCWRVKNADEISKTIGSYLEYIKNSKGEISVAKNVFVETKCGWFSERSVYYMAYAKPVIVQDTGWNYYLPDGDGIFSFNSIEDVKRAVSLINENYFTYGLKAREIAFEFFESTKVMNKFLNKIGI